MHIFFGVGRPTHMVRTYPYVKYMEYPPRVPLSHLDIKSVDRVNMLNEQKYVMYTLSLYICYNNSNIPMANKIEHNEI